MNRNDRFQSASAAGFEKTNQEVAIPAVPPEQMQLSHVSRPDEDSPQFSTPTIDVSVTPNWHPFPRLTVELRLMIWREWINSTLLITEVSLPTANDSTKNLIICPTKVAPSHRVNEEAAKELLLVCSLLQQPRFNQENLPGQIYSQWQFMDVSAVRDFTRFGATPSFARSLNVQQVAVYLSQPSHVHPIIDLIIHFATVEELYVVYDESVITGPVFEMCIRTVLREAWDRERSARNRIAGPYVSDRGLWSLPFVVAVSEVDSALQVQMGGRWVVVKSVSLSSVNGSG